MAFLAYIRYMQNLFFLIRPKIWNIANEVFPLPKLQNDQHPSVRVINDELETSETNVGSNLLL